MEDLHVSAVAILAFMVFFHIVGGYYVYKQKASKAVFERSKTVLVLSNIFNVLEIAISLVFGICVNDKNCSQHSTLAMAVISIFLSNGFYMTTLLRAYRILVLTNLQSGNFSSKNFEWNKSQLTLVWNISLILIGAFLLSAPYTSYLIYQFDASPAVISDPDINAYFSGTVISLECIVFALALFELYRKSVHPCIKIEFLYQVLLWGSALAVLKNPLEQRLLYMVPIRNFAMMLIMIVSVYEHNSSFKPPLPPDIDLEFVLHNQEFYQAFKKFIEKSQGSEQKPWLDLLGVLLRVRIAKAKEKVERQGVEAIKEKVIECEMISEFSKNEFLRKASRCYAGDEDEDDLFFEIEEICYNTLNVHMFSQFKESKTFIKAQVKYLAT